MIDFAAWVVSLFVGVLSPSGDAQPTTTPAQTKDGTVQATSSFTGETSTADRPVVTPRLG